MPDDAPERFYDRAALTRQLAEAQAKEADAIASVRLLQDQFRQQQEHDGKLIEKMRAALKPFAKIGEAIMFTGAGADDDIEISGKELRAALLAAHDAFNRSR